MFGTYEVMHGYYEASLRVKDSSLRVKDSGANAIAPSHTRPSDLAHAALGCVAGVLRVRVCRQQREGGRDGESEGECVYV